MKLGSGTFGMRPQQEDPTVFRPQLTSLIDVMTFLLVFLVKSYSVEGTVITPADNLQLPVSTSQRPPKPSTMLEITRGAVLAEGRTLASLDAIAAADSLLVPGVYQWMFIQHAKYTDTAASHEVTIQADREIEYSILKKVMFSCSKAGFTDFNVLALRQE